VDPSAAADSIHPTKGISAVIPTTSLSGTQTSSQDAIFERVSQLPIGLRSDLEVSRQIINGKVQYVIRDPLTFSSCSLSQEDYQVFLHLEPNRSVGHSYQRLAEAGILGAEQRSDFHQFIIDLHRRNLIRLPILDGDSLYQDLESRRAREHASLPMRLLSFQLPLLNPDRLLENTKRFAAPLFRTWFLLVWIALAAIALSIVMVRWTEFIDSTSSILALRSLPILVLILCGLKLFHELGHAYACKLFGGNVPEMGMILIIGTPCAYVDSSAAWGFRDRWQRIVVNLAGMYFESLIAIAAVFVWSFSAPGLLHSIAHYTVVLATVVTILFNANPLLKFDGYYVLSDSLGIPNLKRAASTSMQHTLKRLCLGIPSPRVGDTRPGDLLLSLFGAASEIYRFFIVMGIATFLILQVPAVGLILGLLYLLASIVPGIHRFLRYLSSHPETKVCRPRALAFIGGCAAVLALLLFTPVSSSISINGIVGREKETFIRALESGFVAKVGFEPSRHVDSGEVLLEMTSQELQSRFALAESEVRKLRGQWVESLQTDPTASGILQQQLRQAELDLDNIQLAIDRLTIKSPTEGVLTEWETSRFAGRFLKSGEPLVKLESGKWVVRALATAEEFLDSQLVEGDRVEFEIIGQPGKRLQGRVIGVSQASQERIDQFALTQIGGGDIQIDPTTQKAEQSYFFIRMEIDAIHEADLRSGIRVQAMVPNRNWSVGRSLSRRFWQLYQRYLVG